MIEKEHLKMSLRNLLNGLLLLILSSLIEADINTFFSRFNHRFYAVLTPYLYERDAKTTSSALTYATRTGQSSIARRALSTGAIVIISDVADNNERSLLSEVAYSDCTEVFNLFLEHIAPADLSNALSFKESPSRWMPLFYAASGGHAESVRIILEKDVNIDPNFPDRSGRTPLLVTCTRGHAAVVIPFSSTQK